MSGYRVWSCDFFTGEKLALLPVVSGSWERLLSAQGSGRFRIALDDTFTKLELRDLLAHWRRWIVVEYDGVVVFAGVVKRRPQRGQFIEVETEDLWAVWKRRLAIDRTEPNLEKWSVKYSGLSIRTLAKRIVQLGLSGLSSPSMVVPLTLEADVSGTGQRTLYGHHLETVWDGLDNIMARGLNIAFEPRWLDGRLNFRMVTSFGTAVTHELFVNFEDGNVLAFDEMSDGSRMSNNSILVGEGSEEDMLVRSNRSLTSELPLLDTIETRKRVTDAGEAYEIANQLLLDYEHATAQLTVELACDGTPGCWVDGFGERGRFFFNGDPWEWDTATDDHVRRVVSISGDISSPSFSVNYQPTGVPDGCCASGEYHAGDGSSAAYAAGGGYGFPMASSSVTRGRVRVESEEGLVVNQVAGGAAGLRVSGLELVDGELRITGTLTLEGVGNVTGTFTISGPLSITGNVTTTGNFTNAGTFTNNGPTKLNGTTEITGAATLRNTLTLGSNGKITAGTVEIDPAASGGRIKIGSATIAVDGDSTKIASGSSNISGVERGVYLGNGLTSAQVTTSSVRLTSVPTVTDTRVPVGTLKLNSAGYIVYTVGGPT